MRYSMMGLMAVAWLRLSRPLLQVDHIVVLSDRPADSAAPAATRDGAQAPPQKPTTNPKGGSTMR